MSEEFIQILTSTSQNSTNQPASSDGKKGFASPDGSYVDWSAEVSTTQASATTQVEGELQVHHVSVEKLQAELTKLTKQMEQIISHVEQHANPQLLEFDEVTLSVAVSGEGSVSLVGMGAKVAGNAALSIKFKRKSQLVIQPEQESKIDYTKLRDLLASAKWKEADEETAQMMLKAANREKENYLIVEDIDSFPCEDLRTIDQLWVKYSNGHFGFSVQKRIYQSLGGTREYDKTIWEAFGERVGWRVKNDWIKYHDLTYTTQAPEGHLPDVPLANVVGRGGVTGSLLSRVIVSRLGKCHL